MKLISVVTPAFNEGECVDELSRRLAIVFSSLSDRYGFEVIVVENGSVDDTYEKLLAIRERDPRFKIVRLSRNFGIEGAFTAGLRRAKGDAAILMCADLQDPPEVLPRFIELWEQGYENVYGVITRRNDESRVRQFFTKMFYWLMDTVNEVRIPRNASDFRLGRSACVRSVQFVDGAQAADAGDVRLARIQIDRCRARTAAAFRREIDVSSPR